jgi:hypothetical protein
VAQPAAHDHDGLGVALKRILDPRHQGQHHAGGNMRAAMRTCSSLVSCESLKGMCDAPVVSAEMQLPRALRLLLMFFASSNTLPCAPVFEIFSLPAKSTRFKREFFVPPSANFCSRRRIKTLHLCRC